MFLSPNTVYSYALGVFDLEDRHLSVRVVPEIGCRRMHQASDGVVHAQVPYTSLGVAPAMDPDIGESRELAAVYLGQIFVAMFAYYRTHVR